MQRFKLALAVSIAVMCLSGCGAALPKISEEDYKLISDYSAALLLKYDVSNHSRLVDTKTFRETYEAAVASYENAKAGYEADILAKEEERKREAELQARLNDENSSELTSGEGSAERNDGTGGAEVVDNQPIADFLGCSGFSIDYADYKIADSFPDGSDDWFFTMDATTGNDLLIVCFDVKNLSDSDAELNVFEKNATFKISVNGEGYKSSCKTMLEDDLSEFKGMFGGKESKKLVLILEIKEGTEVSDIRLNVKIPSGGSINKILCH